MSNSEVSKSALVKSVLAAALFAVSSLSFAAGTDGIGKPISEKDIAPWDISVHFDGDGLPPGKGSVGDGEKIYQAKCAMCHGEFGEGAKGYPKMLGETVEHMTELAKKGEDTVGVRGINSLWGHAPTLYDYIRRAMPFFAPQSLSNDEAYATTCYVLYLAEIVKDDKLVCDASVLKATVMPSRDNFYTDPRPDVKNVRCMNDCSKGAPEVTGMAVVGVSGDTSRNEAKPANH
ncbi:MAG: c-type cytochrome [Halothiobacillaceae bacterium]|nr:c-type cytochrome [Halothiobacillaceae bacterium]